MGRQKKETPKKIGKTRLFFARVSSCIHEQSQTNHRACHVIWRDRISAFGFPAHAQAKHEDDACSSLKHQNPCSCILRVHSRRTRLCLEIYPGSTPDDTHACPSSNTNNLMF